MLALLWVTKRYAKGTVWYRRDGTMQRLTMLREDYGQGPMRNIQQKKGVEEIICMIQSDVQRRDAVDKMRSVDEMTEEDASERDGEISRKIPRLVVCVITI